MDELIKAVSILADEEYRRAAAEHGSEANTPHEGYAIIKEEEEEASEQMSTISLKVTNLWWAVKRDDLASQRLSLSEIRTAAILGACELIQVVAMVDKATAGLRKEMERQ